MEEGTKASCPLALSPALARRGRPRGGLWPSHARARVTRPGTEPGHAGAEPCRRPHGRRGWAGGEMAPGVGAASQFVGRRPAGRARPR